MMFFKLATSFLLVGTVLAQNNGNKAPAVGARAPNNMMAKSIYEMALDGDPFPQCGDIGQNEAFQGRDLFNQQGECDKINICHGNAGFGWNQITVSRSSLDPTARNGHANFEHNDPSNNKREDYFPNTYSVPNPNGAGINNARLDAQCGFVCPAGDTACEDAVKGKNSQTADPPSNDMVTINVLDHTSRPSNGQIHVLEVQLTDGLGYIKEMVAPAADLAAPDQIMEFRGAVMPDDDKMLVRYGVAAGNTLVLVDGSDGGHPGGRGDPHFLTFKPKDGEAIRYDFHGGCDLVLVDNPDYENGLGLKIHIRTKVKTWFSYIEAVAVQIGTDILEVEGGHFDEKRYWVNGKRGPIEDAYINGGMPFTLAGNPVRYRTVKNHVSFQFMIMLSDEEYILIRAVKDYLRVNIENPTYETFGGSVGLMGRFLDGALVSRDGIPMDDFNELGQEWQVRNSDVDGASLFHELVGPQYPEKCEMPQQAPPSANAVSPAGHSGGSLTASVFHKMAYDEAAKECDKVHASKAERQECIEDILATGDMDMAEEYDAEGL